MFPLDHLVARQTTSGGETERTSAASASNGNSDVPINVIVGGTLAGMALAIAIIMAWAYCSRAMKRRRELESKKAHWLEATKNNTLQNAAPNPSMRARSMNAPPLSVRASTSRVTFSGKGKDSRDLEKGQRTANLAQPSLPKALRPLKRVDPDSYSGSPTPSFESQNTRPLLQRDLTHMPSTVSSASWYSTESGEEHLTRPPASLIRAAFNRMGQGVDAAINRSSSYSNVGDQSRTSRHLPEGQSATQPSRISQATTTSAYSQTGEGLAL